MELAELPKREREIADENFEKRMPPRQRAHGADLRK
jgi:hypothetical protein